MKTWKVILPLAVVLLLAGQALAQADEEERMRAAETREAEMEQRLREAEKRMEEAAREIAEITSNRLPKMVEMERRFMMSDKPRLGVMIESEGEPGPVEGVAIVGVTPGTAAADAGLRAGDILTAVNGESLSAKDNEQANKRLLDFMAGVEEGDVLKLEYLREGKSGSVEIEPRMVASNQFVWMDDGRDAHPRVPHAPGAPLGPEIIRNLRIEMGAPWAGTALGELELVELSEGLGKYFGTDKGLLVVSAPKSGVFELQDGDVIQSIDGREPTDARHAMRILGSYQVGEKLKLGIMRNKKKLSLDVEIPADQRGSLLEGLDFEIRPAAAPALPPAVRPTTTTA
ncbi:MAG TPA: PDZ domain-containing protein [Woeseiaceae bacterium]